VSTAATFRNGRLPDKDPLYPTHICLVGGSTPPPSAATWFEARCSIQARDLKSLVLAHLIKRLRCSDQGVMSFLLKRLVPTPGLEQGWLDGAENRT
jgi:hypothetical protein